MLEILAAVDVSREDPFAQVSPAVAEEMQQISTAVCIFLDWDDARRELTDRILEAGCALKVIVVRDGETTLPLEESSADPAGSHRCHHLRIAATNLTEWYVPNNATCR